MSSDRIENCCRPGRPLHHARVHGVTFHLSRSSRERSRREAPRVRVLSATPHPLSHPLVAARHRARVQGVLSGNSEPRRRATLHGLLSGIFTAHALPEGPGAARPGARPHRRTTGADCAAAGSVWGPCRIFHFGPPKPGAWPAAWRPAAPSHHRGRLCGGRLGMGSLSNFSLWAAQAGCMARRLAPGRTVAPPGPTVRWPARYGVLVEFFTLGRRRQVHGVPPGDPRPGGRQLPRGQRRRRNASQRPLALPLTQRPRRHRHEPPARIRRRTLWWPGG
jgi:hypothetical protein